MNSSVLKSWATLLNTDSAALLDDTEQFEIFEAHDFEEIDRLQHDWPFWARINQIPPSRLNWTTWLILGGRGAGKTRAGAEWITRCVASGVRMIALVGETYEDAREVMIEGPSGLRAIGTPRSRPRYESSRHRLIWPNGATAHVFSADDPDGLRGFQFEAVWSDEICKWRYPEEAWSNLQLGLRLGVRPRQVATTTPRPMPLLRRLTEQATTITTRTSTFENAGNLAQAFLEEIAATYKGTRLGRQELLGEIIDEVQGSLWSWDLIETSRVELAPELERVVIAVDPPVTHGPDSDECGIVVAGVATIRGERHAYIVSDLSVQGRTPAQWAKRVCDAADEYTVDRVVAEVNQGGDLVAEVLRVINPNIPLKSVRASRGKLARAEPVAALYEQNRIHHVGSFPDLEDQLTSYTGVGGRSPDRLDALVWAITELMLLPSSGQPSIHLL